MYDEKLGLEYHHFEDELKLLKVVNSGDMI